MKWLDSTAEAVAALVEEYDAYTDDWNIGANGMPTPFAEWFIERVRPLLGEEWPLLGVQFGPIAEDGDADEVWLCVKAPGARFSALDVVFLVQPAEQVNR